MKELVNISNISCDTQELLGGNPENLRQLLKRHNLDGIELMLYGPWDRINPPEDLVKGVHLRFWPNWLDFWRRDIFALKREFTSKEAVKEYYSAINPEEWLEVWRDNLRQAVLAGAEYVVFHVCSCRTQEMFSRNFGYGDESVIEAAIELLNKIVDVLPAKCQLLLENLWWPGLTFLRPELAEKLLQGVEHSNVGFMLDTGHLMNTNWDLTNQQEAVEYVLQTVDNLGSIASAIKGIHLHQSLSGEFSRQTAEKYAGRMNETLDWLEGFSYVSQLDQHRPFSVGEPIRILDRIKPEYVVHEFVPKDFAGWEEKIALQRRSLGLE